MSNRRLMLSLGHDGYIKIREDEEFQFGYSDYAEFCVFDFCKDVSEYIVQENNFIVGKIGVYENYSSIEYNGLSDKINWQLEVLDVTPPVITLNGDKEISIFVGDAFDDPGAVAEDNYDKDLTDKIEVVSDVDASKSGTYSVNYSVHDVAGNSVEVKRSVIVKEKPKPVVRQYVSTYNSVAQQSFVFSNKESFFSDLEKYIKDSGIDVGIGYYDFSTGFQYTYNPGKVFYGASLVKTVDAMYAYDKNVLNDDIRALASKAINVSDNNAYMRLVDTLGRNNVYNYGQSLGAGHFMTGTSSYYYGDTTVSDQLAIWKYFWTHVDSMNYGSELKSYFANTYYNNIQAGCGITTYHKAGWYIEVLHDVGVVMNGNSPYLLVVLTNEGQTNGPNVVKKISKEFLSYNSAR